MSLVSTELEIVNLALDHLGQNDISAAVYTAGSTDNAIVTARQYPVVRRALLRAYPFEFAFDSLPLAQVDPNGLMIDGSSVDGAFNLVADSDPKEYDHETSDYYVSKISDLWVVGNAAGTKEYFTTANDVANPWDVATWVAGTDVADLSVTTLPRMYPGTPRNYQFLYKLPTDCVAPWKIFNPGSRSVDNKIRFKPFKTDYLVCDTDEAVLEYAYDNTTVTEWDDLFVQVMSISLAIACHNKVKGATKGKMSLMQEAAPLHTLCGNLDASTQHEDNTATTGRRYLDI